MSLKENYIELSKKVGGSYAITKKGIERGWIVSILQGSDIGISKAYKIAKALGVTMEELYLGTEKAQEIREEAAEYWGKYRPRNQEEERYIGKLLDILRGTDEDAKIMVKKVLDNAIRDAWSEAERALKKTELANSSA